MPLDQGTNVMASITAKKRVRGKSQEQIDAIRAERESFEREIHAGLPEHNARSSAFWHRQLVYWTCFGSVVYSTVFTKKTMTGNDYWVVLSVAVVAFLLARWYGKRVYKRRLAEEQANAQPYSYDRNLTCPDCSTTYAFGEFKQVDEQLLAAVPRSKSSFDGGQYIGGEFRGNRTRHSSWVDETRKLTHARQCEQCGFEQSYTETKKYKTGKTSSVTVR
jgi:hypothetical protein